jgi:aminoglycoside phosphotransferase family enzyme/predicted kinase
MSIPALPIRRTEPDAGSFASRVVETHVSYVVFIGDLVYKLKKPVVTDFLDFGTVEARRAACEAEVRLNRRLAPDVYLGVATVTGPDRALCDHLVVMRRMPDDRRLTRLVTGNAPDVTERLHEIAVTVANFHASADRSPEIDETGQPEQVLANWAANTAALRKYASVVDQVMVERVDQLARRYVEGRRPLFAERIAAGRVVDGHGDLLADDIFCLPDGPRILDCLEFDPRLRAGDSLADVAFLAMDLERLDRPDLASRFLAAYQEASGDDWPESLAHHWIAYRAQVRAKVACLRASQSDHDATGQADRLLGLAARHLDAAVPRLVLVGGLPGTGKSTLAAAIGEARSWPVLRSDVIRKQLAGLDPLTPAASNYGTGLYRAEATAETYAELLGEARILLARGHSVVLDASWTRRCWRDAAAELAANTGALLVPLRCQTLSPISASRLQTRAGQGGDPSDATEQIASAMALTADEWHDANIVNTTGPPRTSVDAAQAVIDNCAVWAAPSNASTPGLTPGSMRQSAR